MLIRPIDPKSEEEISLIALRMKATLIEVLGKEQGETMYSQEWLINRVREHINGEFVAKVYLAVADNNEIIGHTIVRIEHQESKYFGLFSTIYIEPCYRNQHVASKLITTGETWFLKQKLISAATYTSSKNTKLISLFEKHDYSVTTHYPEKNMLKLHKMLFTN